MLGLSTSVQSTRSIASNAFSPRQKARVPQVPVLGTWVLGLHFLFSTLICCLLASSSFCSVHTVHREQCVFSTAKSAGAPGSGVGNLGLGFALSFLNSDLLLACVFLFLFSPHGPSRAMRFLHGKKRGCPRFRFWEPG